MFHLVNVFVIFFSCCSRLRSDVPVILYQVYINILSIMSEKLRSSEPSTSSCNARGSTRIIMPRPCRVTPLKDDAMYLLARTQAIASITPQPRPSLYIYFEVYAWYIF